MARVLLVEDHEEIWDFLSRRLRRRGFDVILAHDGESALRQARAGRPDVILLDMNLPILDGWSCARALKAGNETRSIPVIALTAHAMPADRAKALDAGCDDYHAKPVDFTRLLAQIASALSRALAGRPAQPAR